MRAILAFAALVLMAASASAQTSANRHYTGELTSRARSASFQVDLQAGQVVTISTQSRSNIDTMLTLNAPGNRRVAQNDDRAQGDVSSRIVYVASAAGRYTAVVTGFQNATGPFDLYVHYGLDAGLSDAARTLREETVTFSRSTKEGRYAVDLNAGDIVVATTFAQAENLDTTLALLDASGANIASNDDGGDGSLNSQIIYRVERAGRYQVVARTYNDQGDGAAIVSIAVDPNAKPPFNFASVHGTPIATHEGELSDATPSRDYPVQLAAGQTLYASTEATGEGATLDTLLRLSDAHGDLVALNDDRGDGSLNSAFAYTARTAGTYTLTVTRYAQSTATGAYRVVLSSVDASVVAELQAAAENPLTLSGPEQVIQTQNFRLYYTTEGRDATTADYAQATSRTLEEILQTQTRMGWAQPPRDPDGRYRAYIAQADGNMGYTKPVEMTFDNPNTANVREQAAARGLFVIDNDFAGMGKKAPPLSLMRATATHEFNHVIQYGYDSQEALNWLYEATASWTETVTVGDDQDATDYVEDDYATPELCWTTTERGRPYSQWTLLQSMADAYGNGIVVKLWENSVTYDGFETMSRTLAGVNTDIPALLERWRVQNFARDYALAGKFARTVKLGGTINRNGSYSPRGRIEQLGANYVAVRLQGRRNYALHGDQNLVMVGLGKRNGQIEAIPLGREGVFDASPYEYAAIMVFNRAVPATPGACTGVSYSINVTPSEGAVPAEQYHFSAAHFGLPSN